MLTPGFSVDGGVALRKRVYDFMVARPSVGFRARQIAEELGLTEKQVGAVLAQLSSDQKAAVIYPHIVKTSPGVFEYNTQVTQRFTVKKKAAKKPIRATVENSVQPMADYTVDREAIVLRHRSGKLFIARPVN